MMNRTRMIHPAKHQARESDGGLGSPEEELLACKPRAVRQTLRLLLPMGPHKARVRSTDLKVFPIQGSKANLGLL